MFDDTYKMLSAPGEGLYKEKGSKFIATAFTVMSEDEVKSALAEVKMKYYDARHNCYAYVLGKDGDRVKFSDDGEPSQTAGLPIYNVIKETGVRNVCVVVTRYFGGTLLGAGPLARMYAEATKLGLEASETAMMRYGIEFGVKSDYSDGERIRRYLESENAELVNITYSDKMEFLAKTGFEAFEKIREDIVSLSSSRAEIFKEKEAYFIDRN